MKASVRESAVLIVDIADSVRLRKQIGEAAAERRIRHLLNTIITGARERGGTFVKSYGDDVLLIFPRRAFRAAASTAVLAQRAATDAGLGLYAGLHAGPVEFRETMGHPDAVGLTVNVAARLHKLTEGVPGQIFLTEADSRLLGPELRPMASPYGPRELKGAGSVNVWTLNWRQVSTTFRITHLPEASHGLQLVLRHRRKELRLMEDGGCLIGRGKVCRLRIHDPEPRISSTHLQIERSGGCWLIQDVSRNGTWLREQADGAPRQLPFGVKVMLPNAGELCLGRPFADDAVGRFAVRFATVDL